MNERGFQRRLAAFIRRHPCRAEEGSRAYRVWHREFEAFAMGECSLRQCKVALALYELHVQNEAEHRRNAPESLDVKRNETQRARRKGERMEVSP